MSDRLARFRNPAWIRRNAGRASKGFTLIELIVVIALISLMLAFAFPRFGETLQVDEMRKAALWILSEASRLKEDAVRDNRDYVLHFNMDTRKIWVSDATMTEERRLKERRAGFDLPRSIRITDVETPYGNRVRTGQAKILFSRKGYSNKALIHLENRNGRKVSILIEPFLTRARLYDTHISFQD
jgi:prepilin-type N-terminal cleavage/methylation domain-containing protein